jgi:creatinine amidohydrolase
MSARFYADFSGPAAAERVGPSTVVMQAIGAVEHHGAHLPLATDALVVDALAAAIVRDGTDLDLLVLPTIHYGLSSEHVWAPGTVTLQPATLLALLDDVAASVVRCGARRFAVLNGHGGNTHLLRVAMREIRAKYGIYTFLLSGFLPPDNGGPPTDEREEGLGIHGSLAETSVVLHVRPDLVDMSLAERAVPSWVRDYAHLGFGGAGEFAWLSRDLHPSGVAGDPTLATPDHGKLRFEGAVAHLVETLREVSSFTFPGDE